jgi:hypothetical protein
MPNSPLPLEIPTPVFNWRDSAAHWAKEPGPCRYCDEPTRLLDDDGEHAHKVHAEQAAAWQARSTGARYRADRPT